jgi:hypothetical protein
MEQIPALASFLIVDSRRLTITSHGRIRMNGVIYLVGLVVVVMAVLSMLGMR